MKRRPRATATPDRAPRPIGWLVVAIVLLTVVADAGVARNGFIAGDDMSYVTENPHVLAGWTGSSVRWAMTSTEQANWHPLTWLSHMLDVQWFGLDAGRHHVTSLLLHAANAALLFLVLMRATGAVWRSAIVGALFAVHPLHVESVAWVAERKDVLSTLFGLLAVAAWLSYLRRRATSRYLAAVAAYALGLAAKPMLVTLPVALLLLDFWPLRRINPPLHEMASALPTLIREKLPLFGVAIVSSVITVVAQHRGHAVQTLTDLGLADRLSTAIVAYGGYLRQMVWPVSLSPFYPRPEAGFGLGRVAGAAIALGIATAIALYLVRRAPYVLFGWLWYLVTLLPVIGLVQVGEQAMADRYTYVPLTGIFIAIVWGLEDLLRQRAPRAGSRRWLATAAAGVVLAALALLSRRQVAYWSSTITLYSRALAIDPDNHVAHNNLGLALYRAGRTDEAFAHYEQAVRIRPTFADAQNNLGAVLAEKGRFAEAIDHYASALRVAPGHAKALNNLGLALAATGRVPEAMERWQEALRIDPGLADAHNNLGVALARSGRPDEAVLQFEEALRTQPDHKDARANLERLRAGPAR